MPRAIQPLKAKELPEGINHGNWTAHDLYGCRCRACQEWAARNGMKSKCKRGKAAHAEKAVADVQHVRPVRVKREGAAQTKQLVSDLWPGSRLAMRNCAECGKEFRPYATNQRYCQPACRQRACRKRKAASNGA